MTPKWIASRLATPVLHARLALQRLLELKLLKVEKGRHVSTGESLVVENKLSTVSSRKFQRQLLEKALDSLAEDPFEIRDHSSMTMATPDAFL